MVVIDSRGTNLKTRYAGQVDLPLRAVLCVRDAVQDQNAV